MSDDREMNPVRSSYEYRADQLLKAMRGKVYPREVLVAALREERVAGLRLGRREVIDESDVAAGLTSATARLIGLSLRDEDYEASGRGARLLTEVADKIEAFAALAGSDTGAEGVVTVLREVVGYLKARDYEGASAALERRMEARTKRRRGLERGAAVDGDD